MKKITLLLMACCMSLMTFAAGGNITYVLNGGVTNPDGWTSKEDMYQGLYQSWDAFKGGGQTAWKTLAQIIEEAKGIVIDAVPLGIPAPSQASTMDLTFIQDATVAAKWQWLVDYMDAVCTAQGQVLPSTDASFLRYNLSAFFLNTVRPGWPISANYAVAGLPEAFIPTWKQAFAGPATYDGSANVVIPDPYKEGSSFDGWYEAADFSGAKVTSIPAGADGDKTLYAKWVDYIPTCLEVQALAAGTSAKTRGVVTFVDGNNVYIQDVTAGLLVEFAAAPPVAVGDKITVTGTTAALGAYTKVIGVALGTKEAASVPAAQTILLSTLTADAAPYIFEYIYIEGLKITANDGAIATLSDDVNSIKLAIALAPSTYPVNSKVNVKAVVSYTTEVILAGDISGITLAPVPRPDGADYPIIEGKYKLTNKWMVSNVLDNFNANSIHSASSMVRGMAAKDGKMYFPDRGLHQLTVIDGATGAKLEPVVLDDNVFFKYTNDAGVVADAGTLRYNDIKVDAAGNVLLGNCITSNAQPFQVWKVDLATGSGTLVLEEILLNNPDFAARGSLRFDAFGVYGDVDHDAIIMAQDASVMEAYKWVITNGVVGAPEAVIIDTSVEGTFLTGLTNPGTAPQIFPMDENYFYLDGNATLPTLIDMEGNVVDGFFNVPAEVEAWSAGNNAGHNGLIEFEVGNEYFFLMASMNNLGSPPSAFRLFKWKDANKEFKDIQSLWTLPAAGMGAASNPYRTGMPAVEVNEATKTATIYLYTGENGYGVYEFKIGPTDAIPSVKLDAVKVTASGNKVTVSEPAASIKVYNPVGQLLQNAKGTSSVEITGSGVYIISVQTLKGESITKKVIIR